MTTTMMNMPLLTPDFPHLFNQHVEVDGFTFQEPALDFDLEDDDEAAKDIDDFTSLLASVDDEETARDIDDFATLMNALSKSQEKEADMSDVSIEDLLDVTKEASADVSMDHSDSESEYDDDEDEETAPVFNPALSFRAPIDPRCCIQSPIFRKIDSRIPMVSIPKMDVAFEKTATASAPVKPLRLDLRSPASSTPSSPCRSVVSSDDGEASATYVHNADKCWVCKSNKSEERKRVLHRYVEKRYRRNWKRGARYTARSRVASSRVREGGRFVTKCEWVPVNYS